MMIYAALLLLCGAISVCSQTDCPAGSHPFAFKTCISVFSDVRLSFSAANTRCGDTFYDSQLAFISTANELSTLQGYVRAIGALDDVEMYSVGYMYSSGGVLQSVNGQTASDNVVNNTFDNGLVEDGTTCIALHVNGSFLKVPCNDMLPFVCQYNLTDPEIAIQKVNGVISFNGQASIAYGDTFNLSCEFAGTSMSSVISWSINGEDLSSNSYEAAADGSNTNLLSMPFVSGGTYTCHVTNNDGRIASANFYLFPDPNETRLVPGTVDNIVALPDTQTSLYIQWLVPVPSYAISPLLLQYTVYYSTDRSNIYSDRTVSGLTTDASGLGMYILSGLELGTQYYVAMRAENAAGMGPMPSALIVTETFGSPPSSSPADVTLSRSDDNTALLASWTPITTELPMGELSFYQVEFREAGSEDVSTILIAPVASMSSIFNIINAQSYEVRVAAAVQTVREPREYMLSPFSEWVRVNRIVPVTEIPSDIPTIAPILSEDVTIVLSVVLPVVVVLIIIIVIAVGVALYFRARRDHAMAEKKQDLRRLN